jgi:pilus assembly protein TadC
MRKLLYGLGTTLWLLLLTSPAFAGDGERVGENISHMLGSWAKSLYIGVAAIVAILFLMTRKFTDLAVFMGAAVLVGGFVLAPHEIANTVQSIWQTVTNGT